MGKPDVIHLSLVLSEERKDLSKAVDFIDVPHASWSLLGIEL
jgi:hypothetical protein